MRLSGWPIFSIKPDRRQNLLLILGSYRDRLPATPVSAVGTLDSKRLRQLHCAAIT
jgi:hypothetical protein